MATAEDQGQQLDALQTQIDEGRNAIRQQRLQLRAALASKTETISEQQEQEVRTLMAEAKDALDQRQLQVDQARAQLERGETIVVSPVVTPPPEEELEDRPAVPVVFTADPLTELPLTETAAVAAATGTSTPEEKEEEQTQEEQLIFAAVKTIEEVEPFTTEEFNVANIIQAFKVGTTDPSAGFLDKGNVAQQFSELVRMAIRQAVATRDPNAIQGVLKTLGIASGQIEEATGYSPISEIERVLEAESPQERIQQLRGRLDQDVDVGKLIETLFQANLQVLQRRNLSVEEVNAIRIAFRDDLDNLEKTLAPEEQTQFLFGQTIFRQLQQYIDEHVDNDLLRQVLLGDIQQVISENRNKLGIQLGEAPPLITPISATSSTVLRQSTQAQIASIVAENLREIDIAQRQLDVLGNKKKNLLQDAQRERILNTVGELNEFIQRNNIRDPRTRQLLTVATQRKGKTAKSRPIPVSNEDLVATLRDLARRIDRPTLSFEHAPRRIRDPATGQTREGIIQDLIEMEQRSNIRRMTAQRPRKQLVSSIPKRAKFRNAEIRRGPRRIQKTQGVPGQQMGAEMREIRIRKEITLAELAKIANMIAMEDGSLETINEQPLLDVQKGVTTIQEIVNAIMSQQYNNSGNDFSLIFVPSNPLGGMFLDGPMASIHMNRMLINPVGGDIFSSIFGAVGNVVKTVASVPLALAGAVFGGDIDPSLAKPLFINRARKADSDQHGGALTQQMFNQGELQPEPFISQGGDNQIFHIQPFPFGGRIDNTGFIDRSQISPKFAWGDVPAIKLTSFA